MQIDMNISELSGRIREAVYNLNQLLLKARAKEIDVEFEVINNGSHEEAVKLVAWCSQEVR